MPTQQRRKQQRGFSLIELLVVISIILIIMFFAVPKMIAIQNNARETGAIRAIDTIHVAQVQYQSNFNKCATSLVQLGSPSGSGGAEGPEAAGLISGSLAQGEASGYVFTLTGTPTGYTISAVPKTFGSTGRRTFFMDQTGILRQNWGPEPATALSPEAASTK